MYKLLFLIIAGGIFGVAMGIIDDIIGYKKQASIIQDSIHIVGWMIIGTFLFLVTHFGLS